MFIPSERNWEEMKYESAGCWPLPINRGDEFALIVKMPASSIKALYRSCPISLSIATAETPEGVVLATTLTVADDPDAALMLSGVLRHEEEQVAIRSILGSGNAPIIFFDELSRSVARASCNLNNSDCASAAQMIEGDRNLYAGPWIPMLAEVLDQVQGLGDPQLAVLSNYEVEITTVAMKLSDFETQKSTTLGSADAIDYALDNLDEGSGLEQSTWGLLEHLFEGAIYHSPRVSEGTVKRELTDILTHCDTGVCLFESKVASILTTSLDRTTERRAKGVQKQIDKGLGQLVGAMRNIDRSLPVATKAGVEIQLDSVGSIRFGVIMVSEMLPALDWKGIADKLIKRSKQSNVMLQILDLQELRVLVGISKNDPTLFMAYLSHRYDMMCEKRNALLRMRLAGPTLP